MPENSAPEPTAEAPLAAAAPRPGPLSRWLTTHGFSHEVLPADHKGVETIAVDAAFLLPLAAALQAFGFDYLQCQGAYDEGVGQRLVSFYHLAKVGGSDGLGTEEVRVKVFLDRSGDLTVPTLYPLYRGADWQERESYDMFGISFAGHPQPKRLLMPEDWKGWPLRKDYVQPDFYELQDAY